ncbi:hypothetical protein [Paenibacillus sp. DR312]|uniref:hypothetical protein n=1 Tax=unclassified Paenibacillus TaxID=185978 RepID=UPI001C948E29|nr:hypothetical protein [Paenibacillus sp. DR312]QZN76209.1 hypothetical protein K5K90_02555 [Paenibacillus sp. DR312]
MDGVQKIRDTIAGYEKLLKIIEDNTDKDSICRLTKKEITKLYGLSYTGTCKKLGFLLRYGLLKVINGGYLQTEKNVVQDTPLSLLPKILVLMANKPEVYDSFKQQAELLSVSMEDVQTAWGFYSYFFGSKYPQEEELIQLKEINSHTQLSHN